MHCEMPVGDVPTLGTQLWVNLKTEHKMCEPQYQELLDKNIPRTKKDGVWVKVIAGESMGIKVSGSFVRLAPSLCIFYSTKSDIYGIIMNPPDGWGFY